MICSEVYTNQAEYKEKIRVNFNAENPRNRPNTALPALLPPGATWSSRRRSWEKTQPANHP